MKYSRIWAAVATTVLLVTVDVVAQDAPNAHGLIAEGSGSFEMRGGPAHVDAAITVFYHMPRSFGAASPILIVVPGAGRNGDEYRDSWIEASQTYGVLVLAPAYPEAEYGPAAYHLGGIVENLQMRNLDDSTPGVYRIDDDDIAFEVNPDRSRWLFHDFDRLFDIVVDDVGSGERKYDIFGHSAGGQIVHRMAIFHPNSKARRMVAANSGFYTVPSRDRALLLGVADAALSVKDLEAAFATRLVLLLGELDDAFESRGLHLATPLANEQGIGRLARGTYFFDASRRIAAALDAEFRWTLEIVPDVGHDQRRMARAAAALLYATR